MQQKVRYLVTRLCCPRTRVMPYDPAQTQVPQNLAGSAPRVDPRALLLPRIARVAHSRHAAGKARPPALNRRTVLDTSCRGASTRESHWDDFAALHFACSPVCPGSVEIQRPHCPNASTAEAATSANPDKLPADFVRAERQKEAAETALSSFSSQCAHTVRAHTVHSDTVSYYCTHTHSQFSTLYGSRS